MRTLSTFSIIAVIGTSFFAPTSLIRCRADTDTYAVATNILANLVETKVLTLSSQPYFFISDNQDRWHKIHLVPTQMIRQFEFKAKFSMASHQPTVMQVAANRDHVTVLIQTSDGQPYCLMADHMLAICDPTNPGGLAYYEGGTALWGLLQGEARTNISFQMTFMGTNVSPAAIFDANFVLRDALSKTTLAGVADASYEVNSRTAKITTSQGSLQVTLSGDDSPGSFGIKTLQLQSGGGVFNFSDFQIQPALPAGLFEFSKQDLQGLNVPLRTLGTNEFSRLQLLIPEGFPSSSGELKASSKLQKLIASRQ